MRIRLSVIPACCFLVGAVACSPFGVNDLNENVILAVTKLTAPATAPANNPLTLTLTLVTGECTTFNHIEVQRFTGGVRLIPFGINARIRHGDIACPDIAHEEPHDVQLDPPFANPFQIYVEQGRLAPVTATVQIE
jgi:hypothetical protein